MNTLIFGDSIARGAFDEQGGRVERLKGSYLKGGQELYTHGIYNFSISGATSENLAQWIGQSCSRMGCFMDDAMNIIINIGSNDATGTGSTTPCILADEYQKNMVQAIESAKKFSSQIILLGNIQIDEKRTLPWLTFDCWLLNSNQKNYNTLLKDIAVKQGCKYVDSREWIDPETDLDDGVHPNTIGHEKIFIKMKEVLDDLI